MRLIEKLLMCFVPLVVLTVSSAQTKFSAQSGVTIVSFDPAGLQSSGVLLDLTNPTDSLGGPDGFGFIQVPKGKARFEIQNGVVRLNSGFSIAHVGGFVLSQEASVLRMNNFILSATPDGKIGQIVLPSSNSVLLAFDLSNLRYSAGQNALILDPTDLKLAEGAANAFQAPDLKGKRIGQISFNTTASPRGENDSVNTNTSSTHSDKPDLTFCALDSLGQFGREGDVVGLSLSTTSWNIGNQRLDWYRYPSWRHPVIVRNLYRISDDKIEQIGESGVKHGFFALSDSQCGSGCNDPTDGRQLGVNCTDTYNAFTTADQGGLAPRYEVNPWTGFFDPTTSHLKRRHSHNKIQHLLRVHDADLNLSSSYIAEAYYVHFQDADPMNNGAWKPTRIISGNAGGDWKFDMTPEQVAPNIGFAIDAWLGAERSVISEDNPPVKGHSRDGRLLVAYKARDMRNGQWRYEYAIYNLDLSRAMKSFSVPVPSTVQVSDMTFHASEHESDELNVEDGIQIDNAQWTAERLDNSVAWSTKTNPLRWGTLYNFGFTADGPPATVQATFGLFKPGTPESLTGSIKAPTTHQ